MKKWMKRIGVVFAVLLLLAGVGIYAVDQYLTRVMVNSLDSMRATVDQQKEDHSEDTQESEQVKSVDDETGAEKSSGSEASNAAGHSESSTEQTEVGSTSHQTDSGEPTEQADIATTNHADEKQPESSGMEESNAGGQPEVDQSALAEEERSESELDKKDTKGVEQNQMGNAASANMEQPLDGNQLQESEGADDEEVLVIPEEELEDQVTMKDRADAYVLAVSRLSNEQISRLFQLSEGGFTPEEKKEALDMFYNNFTPEEQEWILSMYEKYMN